MPSPYGRQRPDRHVTRSGSPSTCRLSSRTAGSSRSRVGDDRNDLDRRVVRERSNSRIRVSSSSSRPTNGVVSTISSPVAWATGGRLPRVHRLALPLSASSPRSSHRKIPPSPDRWARPRRRRRSVRPTEAARDVQGVTGREALAGIRVEVGPDEGLARADPDPHVEVEPGLADLPIERSAARMARSGSSSCADGMPKTPDDRIADELLDNPPNAWMRRRAICGRRGAAGRRPRDRAGPRARSSRRDRRRAR